MKDFDENEIIHNLKIDARAVGIPEGAAEVFVERTIRDAKKNPQRSLHHHRKGLTPRHFKRT